LNGLQIAGDVFVDDDEVELPLELAVLLDRE
jgi:hypothetical protein